MFVKRIFSSYWPCWNKIVCKVVTMVKEFHKDMHSFSLAYKCVSIIGGSCPISPTRIIEQ